MRNLFRKYFPYLNNCKCYRIFIESDGSTTKITKSDLKDVEATTTTIKMPENFHVVDYKTDMHVVDLTAGQTEQFKITIASSGIESIYTMNSAAFDYGYVYVYGHFYK